MDSYYQGKFSDEHMLELQGVAADLVALQSLDPVKVAPMPKEAFEFGMKNGNLLDRGGGGGTEGPGLGISVDWDRLTRADFHVYSKLDLSVSPEPGEAARLFSPGSMPYSNNFEKVR